MKRTVACWIPFAFCTGICLIALCGSIGSSGWWSPVFFGFLPMSFYFLGTLLAQMQREIQELRREVEVLKGTTGEEHLVTSSNAEEQRLFVFSLWWLLLMAFPAVIAVVLILRILELI